ncbi:MAG: glycosyltransferase family 2 protein [Bacteroidales bacterium]|nr:glycosyltransferase family 2 protein [Bacteroidales bacterium]
MKLSIIIPLFNEAGIIVSLLEELKSIKFPEFVKSHEIIVVDDASSDQSYKLVKKYAENYNNIQIIHHNNNKGKGAAVKTGIQQASGNVFMIQDADMELTPHDIPGMLEAMFDLNIEFVNGSRYLPGVVRPLSSYKRYLANRFFTFLVSFLINVKFTDMACGHKLIHKNLYNKIKLKENRFGFEAELIIKALRVKRNNVTEIPVQYFPRNQGEGKKLRNKDAFRIIWVIIKYGLFRF